jgi:5'-nucleotidase/UDP-sugar diphosphatase
VIPPGPVTQYDVIRVLPFGGSVVEVRMTGEMLTRVLDRGEANRGQGGFLESVGVDRTAEDGWAVDGEPVQPDREYRLAVAAFLLTGREQGFDFLTRDADGVTVVREGPDIRTALIAELRAVY